MQNLSKLILYIVILNVGVKLQRGYQKGKLNKQLRDLCELKGNEKILICHLQLITTTRICASRFKCATLLFPFAFNKNIPHLFDSLRSGFYLLLWKHCSYVKAKSATSSF